MYWFLRLHYLLYFPVLIGIPLWYGYVMEAIPLESDGNMADGFMLLLLTLLYVGFFLGQCILWILMQTRSDVSISRTFGSFDAWSLTALYVLVLLAPLFYPGYDVNERTILPSLASQHAPVFFSDSSGTILTCLALIAVLLYIGMFAIIVYERIKQTSIELGFPQKNN